MNVLITDIVIEISITDILQNIFDEGAEGTIRRDDQTVDGTAFFL